MLPIKNNFKTQITQLLSHNFSLAAAWRSYLIRRLLNEKLFIVYSDGKVGSTTLTVSLKNNFPRQFVFHIHRLTKEAILQTNQYYQQNYTSYTPLTVPDNVIQSQFLERNLPELASTKQIFFFSLVRDPIGALVSEYCENYPYQKMSSTYSEEEMTQRIIENILAKINSDALQHRLNWFERELNQVLETDIYAAEFDPIKGYHIYKEQSLLILKLETLNDRIVEAMQEFLGVNGFILSKGNQAEDSNYSNIYQFVKQAVKLPLETLNQVYASKYVQYFYSDLEIQKFKQRWQG
ncbi:MAG: putative capsular polysaccharide synthesis family protein [Microcystaceae cyanobacterium]